jgi:methyltransferase (TIGR00027 family)
MDLLARLFRPGPGPSRTSQAVALTRAPLARPHTPGGDPDAQRRLCRGMRPAGTGRLRASLIARTRFFDERVLAALSAGVRQVVILGAGYDDRALRFRTPGVRFFELDHPATQADKRRILDDLRADLTDVAYAPADFTVDDVAAALADAGHDADAATLFLVEGLLIYLPERVIVSLLTALRARATSASELAVSISRGGSPEFQARVAAVGEHARSSFNEDEARLLLQRCGWQGDTARSVVLASPA